jgi:hypothetical protein
VPRSDADPNRDVIRQNFSDQFPETGAKGNRGEMNLRLSRPHDDVTPSPRDHGPAAFVRYCDQCYVVDEVDIQEKPDFRLREVASYSKETTVKGLPAAASDGCNEIGPVVRSEGADFDPASIAQRLKCRIVGWFQHDRPLTSQIAPPLRAQPADAASRTVPLPL